MNFLAEHFWKFLLLIIISVGSWFGYDKYAKQQQWDRVIESFRTDLNAIDKSPTASNAESLGNYWKLLANLHDFKQDLNTENGVTPIPPKDSGGEKSENSTKGGYEWLLDALSLPTVMLETTKTNFTTCEQFGLFSTANLAKMKRGENPTIENGSYKGEKAIISQRVPIFAAREACHQPANFIILPESVAAIDSSEVDDAMKSFALKLKQSAILNTRSMEAISRLHDQAKQ